MNKTREKNNKIHKTNQPFFFDFSRSLLQMKPIDMVKDSDQNTCFHGKLEDCNRDHPKANGGNCQYWHFFPEERRKELMEKYKEIIGEKSPDSKIIHKFKDVRFEMEKILGMRN